MEDNFYNFECAKENLRLLLICFFLDGHDHDLRFPELEMCSKQEMSRKVFVVRN